MKYMKRGYIVKEERFDELAQYGYIFFMSLFIIIALAGWLLDVNLSENHWCAHLVRKFTIERN